MQTILDKTRAQLKKLADPKIKKSTQHFFKEQVKAYGLKTPLVTQIARENFKFLKQESKKSIWQLCESLWQSGYLEESFIACSWSYALRKQYLPEDFQIFEKWVGQYINNWASCDTFCNHTIGTFVSMYPEFLANLKTWAKSPNRWQRRAAAVSLIVPGKRGLFLEDILALAEILLRDPDDMVQKGYGWLLKVTSQAHQHEVYQFVLKHKDVMPRTALRYAIEKLPATMKQKAMERE
ncbi:MAG: DNA alkylation repair protein [bacterium]